MTGWRLLVCRAPEDGPDLLIDQMQLNAALARAGRPFPLASRFVTIGSPGMDSALAASNVLIGWRLPTRLLRDHGAGLRLIQLTNAGIDNLAPFGWLPDGAALCNARGIHAAKLREWSCMVLLMLHAQMPYFATSQRAGLWSRRPTPRIAGKTALIFGTGALGSAVACAAKDLGLRTIGVRRKPAPASGFDQVLGLDAHGSALPVADFVVLTLPLTDETQGLAGRAFFAAMRPGAGFANFGRGGLVDQPALCDALEAGTPGGAIIDVTSPEPLPPDSPLWAAKNLIITPHLSCDDPATYVPDVLDLLVENLRRLGEGQPLRNQVDVARGY